MTLGHAAQKPNVVLVMTDDQGYGDLGCTGNPWIQTPNIDGLYGESVRFTDFHVSPLCTPTRGALMTGHNPLRNGAGRGRAGTDGEGGVNVAGWGNCELFGGRF